MVLKRKSCLKMIYHIVVVPGNDFEIANYYP